MPHDSAVPPCLSVVFIPQEAGKQQQQQERRARADRVGAQAGLLCERLFYIRNDIPSYSIPFASREILFQLMLRVRHRAALYLFFRLLSSHVAASLMAEVFPLAPLRQVLSTSTIVGPVFETHFSFSLCQYENLNTVAKMSFPKDQFHES